MAMSTGPGFDARPARTFEDEYTISFGDVLRMLWRRRWLITLIIFLFMGAATGYSLVQKPTYEVSIKILVGQKQNSNSSETNLSGSDIQGLQILTKTVAEAVDTRRVAEGVIAKLNLPMAPGTLMNNVSVETIPDTQFVRVKYRDQDPVRAQQVANAYGDVATKQISDISSDASAVTATVWERAELPDEDQIVSPKPLRNVALALVLGAMLGVILVLLLETYDASWRSAEEVERVSGIPTVGIIPKFTVRRGKNSG